MLSFDHCSFQVHSDYSGILSPRNLYGVQRCKKGFSWIFLTILRLSCSIYPRWRCAELFFDQPSINQLSIDFFQSLMSPTFRVLFGEDSPKPNFLCTAKCLKFPPVEIPKTRNISTKHRTWELQGTIPRRFETSRQRSC